MNAFKDSQFEPEITPSPPPQARKKGRRLRTAANVRALVAHTLREIEASTTIDPTSRARLLLYGSQVLAKVIETTDVEQGLKEMEKKIQDLKRRREVEQGHAGR